MQMDGTDEVHMHDTYFLYRIYEQLNYPLNSEQHLSIMAPMPTSKKPNNANPNFLYATNVSDGSSSPTSSSPPSSTVKISYVDPAKSQCSSLSDGESFEGYGENELGSIHLNHGGQLHDGSNNERKINLNGSGVQLELKPHSGHSSTPQQQDDDLNILPRDNWARMSLRRTPNSSWIQFSTPLPTFIAVAISKTKIAYVNFVLIDSLQIVRNK
ncbi:hypothetical protein GQX74_002862 [Glossina fuscipes]|nr:hypothetical protein GQX74_002862 [Glossina fuscipes]